MGEKRGSYMSPAKNKKVIKMKKRSFGAFGFFLIFLAVLIILLFIQSFTREHVSIYEVMSMPKRMVMSIIMQAKDQNYPKQQPCIRQVTAKIQQLRLRIPIRTMQHYPMKIPGISVIQFLIFVKILIFLNMEISMPILLYNR